MSRISGQASRAPRKRRRGSNVRSKANLIPCGLQILCRYASSSDLQLRCGRHACAAAPLSGIVEDSFMGSTAYDFLYLQISHLSCLHQTPSFFGPTTRWETILILLYWTGTAVCNVIGVKSLPEAGLRAGSISVFHLIPLLLSDRLRFAADLFGLSPQLFQKSHTSLGFMATAQGVIHVAIFLSKTPFQVQQTTHFHGLLVSRTPFHFA